MTKRRKFVFQNGEPLVCIECNNICEGEEGKDWMRLPAGGYIHLGGDEESGKCWSSYLKFLKKIIWEKSKKEGQQRLF